MRSFVRMWMLGAAAMVAIGCGSGGTNDVTLVGANHGEDPGAKSNGTKTGTSLPANTVGTMQALCIEACSHIRAANCKNEPANTVSECLSECASSSASECDDELAAFYHCELDSPVVCSSAGSPKQTCVDPSDAYESCVSNGSGSKYPGCVAQSQYSSTCSAYSLPNYTYYQCSSSSSPGTNCVMLGANAFCCP